MLKLDKCPRLLNTLMAHAGIFNSVNIREIFTEFYTNIRKQSLESFWKDCLADKQYFLELGYEDFFLSAGTDDECVNEVLVARDTLELTDGSGRTIPELEFLAKKIKSTADFEQLDFLSLARGLGTHDYIGQRVHQIATILRNLSFIEENMGTLSRNRSFLRLLVMMSNVQWSNLHHMGLDMLGNVAPEIELADPTTDHLSRCIMSTITDGLESPDRGVIISCLEILSKLLHKECNEDSIHKCLTQKIYNQICVFLCLNDIMLLLYTLECIYSLSSLGEKACTQLMHVRGIIDTLVSLVTVEAQSYGPDACILMRVVETIPSNMLHHHQQQKQQAVTQQLHIQNEPISSIPATITVQSAPEPPSELRIAKNLLLLMFNISFIYSFRNSHTRHRPSSNSDLVSTKRNSKSNHSKYPNSSYGATGHNDNTAAAHSKLIFKRNNSTKDRFNAGNNKSN